MAEPVDHDNVEIEKSEELEPVEDENKQLTFKKPVLVYLPCYNCEKKIADTISEIPQEFHEKIECLVVDNDSEDKTSDVVLNLIESKIHPFKIHLIRTHSNVGYSGSQKLAFSIAVDSPEIDKVIMLHGDGQYPPQIMKELIPYLDSDYALINGHRSKRAFPEREETPLVTFAVIRILSFIESLLLGISQKEWHSGFVMYRKEFLSKIPVQNLSQWMHIDGEFLMCAAVLKEKTLSIPIYKRYKGFEIFSGADRTQYIGHVFKLMMRYKKKYYHRMIEEGDGPEVDVAFDIKGE